MQQKGRSRSSSRWFSFTWIEKSPSQIVSLKISLIASSTSFLPLFLLFFTTNVWSNGSEEVLTRHMSSEEVGQDYKWKPKSKSKLNRSRLDLNLKLPSILLLEVGRDLDWTRPKTVHADLATDSRVELHRIPNDSLRGAFLIGLDPVRIVDLDRLTKAKLPIYFFLS